MYKQILQFAKQFSSNFNTFLLKKSTILRLTVQIFFCNKINRKLTCVNTSKSIEILLMFLNLLINFIFMKKNITKKLFVLLKTLSNKKNVKSNQNHRTPLFLRLFSIYSLFSMISSHRTVFYNLSIPRPTVRVSARPDH